MSSVGLAFLENSVGFFDRSTLSFRAAMKCANNRALCGIVAELCGTAQAIQANSKTHIVDRSFRDLGEHGTPFADFVKCVLGDSPFQ